jgi:hypothetical protein
MVMINLRSPYLAGCGLLRWNLNNVGSLNLMIDGVYQVGKNGVEITLHMIYQLLDFNLYV